MSSAFKGGLSVKAGDGASPEVFSLIEEVTDLGGLGVTNGLIDVTNHDSTAMEYIAGLADGSDLSIECNRIQTASNVQDDVIAQIIAGSTDNYEITLTDGSNAVVYTFAAVGISYSVTPAVNDKATLSLGLKISGSITIS